MSRPLDHSTIDLVPGHELLERLKELAGTDPERIALQHKTRGRWVAWRWRAVVTEVDRIAGGLRHLGLTTGSALVVSGEIGPHLLLVAAAARVIGAKVLSAPRAAGPDLLRAILTGGHVSVVFTQGRTALAAWLKAWPESAERRRIVFDHVTADGHSPHPDVITYAHLRVLAGPVGWADAVSGPRNPVGAGELLWVEETTDWHDGLDHVTAAWIAQRPTLVFPEIIAAATRDRRQVRPSRWLASARGLAAAARDIESRFPHRTGLSGRLVAAIVDRGQQDRFARLGAALLRSRLGLNRLDRIDIVGPREAASLDGGTGRLFRGLGVRLEPTSGHPIATLCNPAVQTFEMAGGVR